MATVAATQVIAASMGLALFLPGSGDQSGVTDTPVWQAALNTMAADTTGNARALLVGSQLYINAKSKYTVVATAVGQGPVEICGIGQSTIWQVTSNTEVLEFDSPVGTTAHNISISNLGLGYLTQQTGTTAAIGFTSATGTGFGTEFQLYFDRLYFQNCARGLSNVQVSGQFAIWGIKATRCSFFNHAAAAFYFKSPAADGAPNISIDHAYVLTYNGGSETLCSIDACDSLTVSNLECNQLTNQSLLSITSCNSAVVTSCKLETCTYSSATNPIVFIANTCGSINGLVVEGMALTATNLYMISYGTGSYQSFTARGLVASLASGTGSLRAFNLGSVRMTLLDNLNVASYGSGPATVSLVYSGGSNSASMLEMPTPPGGTMSDDLGAITSYTWNALTSPRVLVLNSPLTAPCTITVHATNGSANADNCSNSTELTIVRTANSNDANALTVICDSGTFTVATASSHAIRYRRSLGGMIQVS